MHDKSVSLGCSFTYGHELANHLDAWPFLVAKHFGWSHNQLAQNGSGNDRIMRGIIRTIPRDYNYYLIGWTHYARKEHADELGVFDIWPGQHFKSFKEPHRQELSKYFSRNHDQKYLYRRYMENILYAQAMLEKHHKKYVMVDAFSNHIAKWHNTHVTFRDTESDLSKQINTKHFAGWSDYDAETMVEWSYGTPQGPKGHPLEEGHRKIADKIIEHIEVSW
tara:strand:- start:1758 stop:2420 length:663 start_codon:yes stop_codon:yes gene_type:complete